MVKVLLTGLVLSISSRFHIKVVLEFKIDFISTPDLKFYLHYVSVILNDISFNGIGGKFYRNKQVVEIVHAQDHVHDKLGVLSVNVKKFLYLVRLRNVILNEATDKKGTWKYGSRQSY